MMTNISSMGTPSTPSCHGGLLCRAEAPEREATPRPHPPLCSDTLLARKSISFGSNATLPSVVQAKTLESALGLLLTP